MYKDWSLEGVQLRFPALGEKGQLENNTVALSHSRQQNSILSSSHHCLFQFTI